MGVNQFSQWQKLYAPNAVFYLPLNIFKGRRIGVDALGWMHSYLSTSKKQAINKKDLFANDPTVIYRILCKLTGQLLHFLERLWNVGITPVFFFDGAPHPLKQGELDKRYADTQQKLTKITALYQQESLVPGSVDRDDLHKKVVGYPHMPHEYITSFQNTLTMLGVPWVIAEHDGEQLAARCCAEGLISAVWSTDSDNLIFGAPLMIKGFVHGQPDQVEVVYLDEILRSSGLNQNQLIDVAILLGCDFNLHIKGIGPVKAMELIRQYQQLDYVQGYDLTVLNYHEVRKIFMYQASNQPHWQLSRDRLPQLGEYIYQLDPNVNKHNLTVAHYNVPPAQSGHIFNTNSYGNSAVPTVVGAEQSSVPSFIWSGSDVVPTTVGAS